MAVAELQVQDIALHRGAIADAVDLEVAGEAGGDAGDHVVDQRPRRAPHRPRPLALVCSGAIVTLPSAIVAVTSLLTTRVSVPSRPLAVSVWPDSSTATPAGIATGFLPIRDMRFPQIPAQNTRHSTSPPTLATRASLSDMTPRGVDRIEMPSPL